jgi:hypothetical protein
MSSFKNRDDKQFNDVIVKGTLTVANLNVLTPSGSSTIEADSLVNYTPNVNSLSISNDGNSTSNSSVNISSNAGGITIVPAAGKNMRVITSGGGKTVVNDIDISGSARVDTITNYTSNGNMSINNTGSSTSNSSIGINSTSGGISLSAAANYNITLVTSGSSATTAVNLKVSSILYTDGIESFNNANDMSIISRGPSNIAALSLNATVGGILIQAANNKNISLVSLGSGGRIAAQSVLTSFTNVNTINTDALTASAMMDGIIKTAPGGPILFTLPAVATFVTNINNAIEGDTVTFMIVNTGAGSVTVTANGGATVYGNAVIASNTSRVLKARVGTSGLSYVVYM